MKKKYKRAGTSSERQDYRKGGQVSKDGPREKLFTGSGGYGTDFSKQLANAYSGNFTISLPDSSGNIQTVNLNESPKPSEIAAAQIQSNTGANMATTEEQKKELARASEIARGQVSNLPTPNVANIPLEGGSTPIVTIDEQTPVSTTQIATPQQEAVTTTTAPQTVAQPESIAPVTVEAAQVEAPPTLTAAQTQVDETKLATTDKVEKPADITPATVEIKEGALT